MASMEFKNGARSTVADNPLTSGATTLNVATGEGANFPDTFPFLITIWDASTYPNPGDDPGMEIVKCTARTTDALTIVRAQEGTADVAHSLGERVAMLATAGHFTDIITKLDTIETDAKDDQTASEVPIVDSGSIITATEVEGALQENRTAIDLNTIHKDSDGSDHTFIDQSVIIGASPTLDGVNITNIDADTLIADVKEANVSAVTKGQMCAIVGSSGNKFEVQLCDCDDAALIRVLGLVVADTAQNETGQVVYKGLLTNVNSQIGNTDVNPNGETWTAGDLLYVSNTPGGLTNVRPSFGRCIKAGRTLKGNSASDTLLAIVYTNSICACAAAGEDICSRMGDNDGVNKHSFKDYANNEVAALDSNGNLTLIGNIDGRDVGTDGTKLDTIEENAAADQNASEVSITDAGSIITATEVEGALQENRTAIDLNTAKETNVSTELSEGTNTETTVDVNSSDGTNATLVAASTLRAGLLTKAKFDEIVANTVKTTNATHTGDVTGSDALTIAVDAVTYSKMQNIVNDERIWGRVSGADGVVEELTKAQVLSMLSVEDGADVTDTTNVTSAGAFMDSEFKNQSFTNLLKNGDFESWNAGVNAVPDAFDSVGGSTVARTTTCTKKTYACDVTRNHVLESRVISQSLGLSSDASITGKNYIASCMTKGITVGGSGTRLRLDWRNSANATISTIEGDYSALTSYSYITVCGTAPANAVYFNIVLIQADQNDNFMYDELICVEGSVCPAFSSHPTDQIPIVLTSAPTDAGTNGETRWYAIAGAGGARRMYMSNGTDWKYQAIAT